MSLGKSLSPRAESIYIYVYSLSIQRSSLSSGPPLLHVPNTPEELHEHKLSLSPLYRQWDIAENTTSFSIISCSDSNLYCAHQGKIDVRVRKNTSFLGSSFHPDIQCEKALCECNLIRFTDYIIALFFSSFLTLHH